MPRTLSENSFEIKPGLTLCCLCGKHKKNSKCEVHLRNIGKWDEKKEEEKVSDILKEIRDVIKDYPRVSPTPVNPMTYWPNCAKCGALLYPNVLHNCGWTVTSINNNDQQ